ncbi:MAG: hypothetical protein EOP45_22140 [Sphingobacteriaceae bacterium]|nr:MAG: hypothetical protein EOP45_22140 [Sphingobacteriaceae bacterium]
MTKMYFLINTDLKMSVGKICSQIGHAAIGCHDSAHKRELKTWNEDGSAKIALKATSNDIRRLVAFCLDNGINHWCVVDSGKTQVPEGSKTLLAIGPCKGDFLNELKLY